MENPHKELPQNTPNWGPTPAIKATQQVLLPKIKK